MSWSPHIQVICSKARKMLGLFYRQYQFCDSKSLKQMYISLVRPHLEYAAQVWDPHLQQNIGDIERVQKFALRICSKEWEKEYTELLDCFELPTLQNRCFYLKICHLYKIIHGLSYFSLIKLFLIPPSLIRQGHLF